MNTIFKFYYQAWVLWSLAASTGIALLWLTFKTICGRICSRLSPCYWSSWGWRIQSSGLPPPQMGLKPSNGLNLDGTAYLQRYNPDEAQAIEWLKQAPFGYVVEAVGGSYSSFARVATLSGLPGILGWPPHESQWRGGAEEMGSRESDIERLYTTPDWQEAKAILDLYKVKYIYVGDLERSTYRVDDGKLSQNLTPVFQNQTVTIYSYDGN